MFPFPKKQIVDERLKIESIQLLNIPMSVDKDYNNCYVQCI